MNDHYVSRINVLGIYVSRINVLGIRHSFFLAFRLGCLKLLRFNPRRLLGVK